MDGTGGNQGMLMVQLLDRKSGIRICAATTHLKAKAGVQNDAIRDHQVCRCHKSLYVGLPTVLVSHAHAYVV